MTTVGENLKRERTAAGLTLEDLAQRAGVRLSTVHRTEKGTVEPRTSTVRRYAGALGIHINRLLDEYEAKKL